MIGIDMNEWLKMRREKYGGADLSRGELLSLRTDSLLAEKGVLVRKAYVSDMERLASRVQGSVGSTGIRGIVVIGGDIRNLKHVNDVELGGSYKLGDEIIVNAGTAIAEAIRGGMGDRVSRVGGDEFLATIVLRDDRGELSVSQLGKIMPVKLETIRNHVQDGLKKLGSEHKLLQEEGRGELNLGWKYLSSDQFGALVNQDGSGDLVTRMQSLVENQIHIDKNR